MISGNHRPRGDRRLVEGDEPAVRVPQRAPRDDRVFLVGDLTAVGRPRGG
ncbi:hypothetical protein R1T08_06650 [Streptomyces sp. SBC-4]|nr:hypothetical protein [Streptomyces sp. SBC-4]MDV5143955.1 hypothetical protein [Streptomyces sp. SBC-4]